MATAQVIHTAPMAAETTGIRPNFQRLWNRVDRALRRRARLRQTIRELRGLSDRALADIGLHRSGIRAHARAQIMEG